MTLACRLMRALKATDMAGAKGRSGGPRPGSGGKRPGAGRKKMTAEEKILSAELRAAKKAMQPPDKNVLDLAEALSHLTAMLKQLNEEIGYAAKANAAKNSVSYAARLLYRTTIECRDIKPLAEAKLFQLQVKRMAKLLKETNRESSKDAN